MLSFGQTDDALAEARSAVDASPEAAEPRLRLAAALQAKGQADRALRELKAAVETEPDHPEAWLRLATAHADEGRTESAVEAYRKALAIESMPNADRAVAHHRLAKTLIARRDPQGAEPHLQAAIELDPTWVEPHLTRAGLLGAMARVDEAADAFARALELDPVAEQARAGHATALILAGRHPEARATLEEGLRQSPQSLALTRMLARHLAACPDPAVRDGNRALELAQRVARDSNKLEDHETLAMAAAQAGDFSTAVERQQSLMQAAEGKVPGEVMQRLRTNLELYKSGKPCCLG